MYRVCVMVDVVCDELNSRVVYVYVVVDGTVVHENHVPVAVNAVYTVAVAAKVSMEPKAPRVRVPYVLRSAAPA